MLSPKPNVWDWYELKIFKRGCLFLHMPREIPYKLLSGSRLSSPPAVESREHTRTYDLWNEKCSTLLWHTLKLFHHRYQHTNGQVESFRSLINVVDCFAFRGAERSEKFFPSESLQPKFVISSSFLAGWKAFCLLFLCSPPVDVVTKICLPEKVFCSCLKFYRRIFLRPFGSFFRSLRLFRNLCLRFISDTKHRQQQLPKAVTDFLIFRFGIDEWRSCFLQFRVHVTRDAFCRSMSGDSHRSEGRGGILGQKIKFVWNENFRGLNFNEDFSAFLFSSPVSGDEFCVRAVSFLDGGARQLGIGAMVMADVGQGSDASWQPKGHLFWKHQQQRAVRTDPSADFLLWQKVTPERWSRSAVERENCFLSRSDDEATRRDIQMRPGMWLFLILFSVVKKCFLMQSMQSDSESSARINFEDFHSKVLGEISFCLTQQGVSEDSEMKKIKFCLSLVSVQCLTRLTKRGCQKTKCSRIFSRSEEFFCMQIALDNENPKQNDTKMLHRHSSAFELLLLVYLSSRLKVRKKSTRLMRNVALRKTFLLFHPKSQNGNISSNQSTEQSTKCYWIEIEKFSSLLEGLLALETLSLFPLPRNSPADLFNRIKWRSQQPTDRNH